MAEIRPIRAWRYNDSLSKDIEELTSPLFDVVSENQRRLLYENPLNSIHLSVPLGDNPSENAKGALENWKVKQIINQDPLPGIYVYYQYFTLAGQNQEFCRKGFLCNIRIYDWPENVILRHENTIPRAVNDRIDILEKTQLNVSPTHGLYTDETHDLEKYMDESMKSPLYESEDYQGVKDVLSVIHDVRIINKFVTKIKDKQIILADGHHRYEGSLAYQKQLKQNDPDHSGKEGYNYHFMYLTNTENDDLRVLPTHRLVQDLPNFDEECILKEADKYFTIKPVADAFNINEIILGKKWAFGLLFKDSAYKLRLKPEVLSAMDWNFPQAIKELDMTILHYFVIEKILGIVRDEQRNSSYLNFDRSFADCLTKVAKEEAQMALITNEISIDTVKKVCYSGHIMPQKSTYFYPKVICGLLFSSIKQDEFESFADTSF